MAITDGLSQETVDAIRKNLLQTEAARALGNLIHYRSGCNYYDKDIRTLYEAFQRAYDAGREDLLKILKTEKKD